MVDVPKGATVPTDHKKSAAQIEAEGGGSATVTFRDVAFQVPSDIDDVDGEFLRYAADGDAYRMTQTVLDAKQFRQFKALKPTIGDYNAVGKQISELYGFDSVGE